MLFGSEGVEHTYIILHNILCFTLFFYQNVGAKALFLKIPLFCCCENHFLMLVCDSQSCALEMQCLYWITIALSLGI